MMTLVKEGFLTSTQEIIEQIGKMTDTHRQLFPKDRISCELETLRLQYPLMLRPVEEGDYLAGRMEMPPVGFTPQVYTKAGGFGYFLNEEKIFSLFDGTVLSEKQKKQIEDLRAYWHKYNSVQYTRSKYPEWVKQALPSDNWIEEPGIAFPLYRMGGSQLDYRKLLTLGVSGLKKQINGFRNKNPRASDFYDGLSGALDLFSEICFFYAEHMNEAIENYPPKKNHYKKLQSALSHIAKESPTSFLEAMQMMYLFNLISGSQNYGRIDDYLGDFYCHDIDNNVITEHEALQYLVSLWKLMDSRKTVYDGRAILGGKGRRNEQNANRFAIMAMEASHVSATVLPQLSLRFYRGMDEALWQKALDVIGNGCVYPMLYNDDVNIPSVSQAFGIEKQTAEQYVPFGCGEYVIYHTSFGTPSGVINLQKALEVVLNRGIDIYSGKETGLKNIRQDALNTFEDLFSAYKQQVEYHVEALALQEKIEYEATAETAPFLFFSLLYDSCIEKGKPIFAGGVDILGGTLETYGNITVSDSLTAIREWVYEKKRYSLEHLRDILNKNFEGHETERQIFLSSPKYGNDDSTADEMVCRVHDHVCEFTRSCGPKAGLDNYLVVVINNDANTDLGKNTGASADGRKAGAGLNNGNSPTPGMDQAGITALLNSLSKPRTNIHAGAVQNIKFSGEMFREHRDKLEAVLSSYFKQGGAQAMITVVNRHDLENAMKEPEKYANLIVRVGGFSAKFVELRKEVQLEILQRTLY